jgi:hypothetical protein
MIEIYDLLPELLTHAPNAPEPLALRYLRETAKVVCRRTRLWRESDEIAVTTPEYEGLCSIQDAAIFEIEWARLGEHDLEPVTPAWLDRNRPGWQVDTEEASPRYVTQLNPSTVTIVPRATGTLKLRLILETSRDAEALPDFFEMHAAELGKGAAGALLLAPHQDLTNPKIGAMLIGEFNDWLNTLAVQAVKGQQKSRLRTTAQFF